MATLQEMQEDVKKYDINILILNFPKKNFSIAVLGKQFHLSMINNCITSKKTLRQQDFINMCKRLNLKYCADDLTPHIFISPARYWNRIAERNDIYADDNWLTILRYIHCPTENILNIPEMELKEFWRYAETVLYNDIIPAFQDKRS
jgi:hypothetical protein